MTVWNENGEMIHISNAEFGIASTVYDQYVYTLRAIQYYGHPLSYSLTRVPFGTMDAWAEDIIEVDESFDFDDEKVYDAFLGGSTIDLNVFSNRYTISYGEETSVIKKISDAWAKDLDVNKNVDHRMKINTEDAVLIEFNGSHLTRSVIVTAERMNDKVKVTRRSITDVSDDNSTEELVDLRTFEDILSSLASIEIKAVRSGYSKDAFIIDGEDVLDKNWSLGIGYSDGHKVQYIGYGGIDSTFILFNELLTKNITTFGEVHALLT